MKTQHKLLPAERKLQIRCKLCKFIRTVWCSIFEENLKQKIRKFEGEKIQEWYRMHLQFLQCLFLMLPFHHNFPLQQNHRFDTFAFSTVVVIISVYYWCFETSCILGEKAQKYIFALLSLILHFCQQRPFEFRIIYKIHIFGV